MNVNSVKMEDNIKNLTTLPFQKQHFTAVPRSYIRHLGFYRVTSGEYQHADFASASLDNAALRDPPSCQSEKQR